MCKMCIDEICTNRCVPPSRSEKTDNDVERELWSINSTLNQTDLATMNKNKAMMAGVDETPKKPS